MAMGDVFSWVQGKITTSIRLEYGLDGSETDRMTRILSNATTDENQALRSGIVKLLNAAAPGIAEPVRRQKLTI